MNVLAYIIYLSLTFFITIIVGNIFYKNGRIYILFILNQDEELTNFINRILLVGYYLMNLGYVTLMINNWKTISTVIDLINTVSNMTGRITLMLGLMHYINLFILKFIGQNQYFFHHKNI